MSLHAMPGGALLTAWPPGGPTIAKRIAFVLGGTRLVTGGQIVPLSLYDTASGALRATIPVHARTLAVSDRWIVAESTGLLVIDAATEQIVASMPRAFAEGPVRDLSLSVDGRTLAASARYDAGVVVIRNVGSQETVTRRFASIGAARAVTLSPDGTRYSYFDEAGLHVANAFTGAIVADLVGHNSSVEECAWSPDGTRLASAGWDKTARVWDPSTGDELAELRGHHHRVWAVTFSPDGKTLATSGWDRTIRFWDMAALDLSGGDLVREVARVHGLVLDGAEPAFAAPEPW